MNKVSFVRENVINKNLIRIHSTDINHIDLKKPLFVKSNITDTVVPFVYDPDRTNFECEIHEGWDGEEYHLYFSDTENRNIILDIWDSPNFH